MEEALRIIVAKSPLAASQAMQTLQALRVKSPVLQDRYNRTVQSAMSDPGANFTVDERALIAEYIGGEPSTVRLYDVRIRVTADEKAAVQEMATSEGKTVSDLIRERIGL